MQLHQPPLACDHNTVLTLLLLSLTRRVAGTCASGGGRPYYLDPAATPIDNDDNLLWFHNYTVPPNGSVWGNGANDGRVSTLAEGGIRSVMLVNTNTGGEFLSLSQLLVVLVVQSGLIKCMAGHGKSRCQHSARRLVHAYVQNWGVGASQPVRRPRHSAE